jgi:fucose 4-O-acetylase-like acetyltransferase
LWSLHQGSEWFFNRIVQLGQNSLLVYWVHIWFVYGGFSILPKQASSVSAATAGLVVIVAAMMMLAWARPWLEAQGRGFAVRVWGRLLPAGEY